MTETKRKLPRGRRTTYLPTYLPTTYDQQLLEKIAALLTEIGAFLVDIREEVRMAKRQTASDANLAKWREEMRHCAEAHGSSWMTTEKLVEDVLRIFDAAVDEARGGS